MIKLSVNVNKIATLRNARGGDLPNLLEESLKIIQQGAQGITVHPRPDQRHIRWSDVIDLKNHISVELNVEGYPSSLFLQKVLEIRPQQCTLVPDPPHVLTSNAGWQVRENQELLAQSIGLLRDQGIRVSLFMDPHRMEMDDLRLLSDQGGHRIELYTESYAKAFKQGHHLEEIKVYQKGAQMAQALGLGVNGGHDLNLENLPYLAQQIPSLKEVSIGHALVCDALNYGWKETISRYLKSLS